jgi:stringent starvation protein B
MAAKSKRPYLLRALFDWIVDSGLTPYLLVAADAPEVHVPGQHVRDGKIVLNISPNAVRNLTMTDDMVSFDGRFSGAPFWVEAPVSQVEAIYAKETGEGMMFDADREAAELAPQDPSLSTSSDGPVLAKDERRPEEKSPKSDLPKDKSKTSHLKIIK